MSLLSLMQECIGLKSGKDFALYFAADANKWMAKIGNDEYVGFGSTAHAAVRNLLAVLMGKPRTVACPVCGRSVLKENQPATGYLAKCGRRLMLISECKGDGCNDKE